MEFQRHRRRLRRIPLRIQVTGTRGKSLLVRMITELFTADGRTVTAKVTGEQPQYYTSANGWRRWPRGAPARIGEQLSFIRRVAAEKPELMLLENMALQPENHFIAATRLVQPTLVIVTNIHPDHQEIMGETAVDVARTIGFSFPRGATVLTPYSPDVQLIEQQAVANGCRFVSVETESKQPNQPFTFMNDYYAILDWLRQEFDLSASALQRTVARWQHQIEPSRFTVPLARNRHFINLFTCNDVRSSQQLIRSLEAADVTKPPFDIVLSCRADRPLRTLAFLRWLVPTFPDARIILVGAFPLLTVRRELRRLQADAKSVSFERGVDPGKIFNRLADRERHVLGLGNYVRSGERIISFLEDKKR